MQSRAVQKMQFCKAKCSPGAVQKMQFHKAKSSPKSAVQEEIAEETYRITGRTKMISPVPIHLSIFSPNGDNRKIRDLPGAAIFFLTFTHDVNNHGAAKDLHSKFRTALLDIAASLQLSRNILVAVLSFQSWKVFMQRWIRAQMGISTAFDNTNKPANDILKSIIQIAEESIPRLGENIALDVGAFCMVLPPSAHAVKSTAIKFLLNWLFQYEHEYRQWSAAISVGAISSNLHATDYKQKF